MREQKVSSLCWTTIYVITVALLTLGGPTFASAQDEASRSRTRASKSTVVAPEREAAARTFAKQHHPELLELLDVLKAKRPNRYATAIRELYNTCESLNRIRERDPERYELELRLWKATSRIQVLAARLTMRDSADLERELRRAIAEQIDARLALQRLTRDRLRARLAQLEKAIAEAERNREAEVERRIKRLRHVLAERSGQAAAARANKANAPSARAAVSQKQRAKQTKSQEREE